MFSSTNIILIETAVLLGTIVYILWKYFSRNFDYWEKRGFPYEKPIPLFGNFKDVFTMKRGIGDYLADLYNKRTDDFFGIWIFNKPQLVVRSPELIKHILSQDFHYFRDRSVANDEKADPIASKMLFLLQNPEWKIMRTKLSPIFTSGKIKAMVPLINRSAEELIIYLSENCMSKKSIDAKDICGNFAVDVITSCVFGVDANSFRDENADFKIIAKRIFGFSFTNAIRGTSYFFLPSCVTLFNIPFFHPSVNKFIRPAFLDAIAERERTGNKRNDMIDLIIEMKKLGTFDGIDFKGDREVAQALQFLAAGFETTSSTIAFTLYEMSLYPELQEKLITEIRTVLDENNGICYEAIKNMNYLDKCIKEVLRKYPTLPFLDRRCMEDYKIPGSNLVIEKGTPVNVPLFGLHYDPEYYPDPMKFDPERYTPENIANRPTYAYIPFGGGPHNCIGERFGVIVSKFGVVNILSNFRVERTKDTPVPIVFDPKSFVLQSPVGIPMRFVPHESLQMRTEAA